MYQNVYLESSIYCVRPDSNVCWVEMPIIMFPSMLSHYIQALLPAHTLLLTIQHCFLCSLLCLTFKWFLMQPFHPYIQITLVSIQILLVSTLHSDTSCFCLTFKYLLFLFRHCQFQFYIQMLILVCDLYSDMHDWFLFTFLVSIQTHLVSIQTPYSCLAIKHHWFRHYWFLY